MTQVIPIHKTKTVNTQKSIRIPGSKSYTNRALLLAALAKGKSHIHNPLLSDDTAHMMKALRLLGIKIEEKRDRIVVIGNGGKFIKPAKPLYLGNAGTAVRFLTAVLAAILPGCTITGNDRMKERPINDLIDALKKLGAAIDSKHGCLPVTIKSTLKGGKTKVSGQISSQYLSALLMASPCATKTVKITVKGKLTSQPYVKMTLDTMRHFGVKVKNRNFKAFVIKPATYRSIDYVVEGDASSASYFWAIAALNGLTVKVFNIDMTSAQADLGFIEILKKMGCKAKAGKNFITVTGPKTLKALSTVNLNHMPDAAMTVAILAAFAKGKSILKGLSNLRVKECDRLKALATEFDRIGIRVVEGKDSLKIHGNPDGGNSAVIETYDDHRMAMCFAIAGTRIPGIKIRNPGCVSKTYPGFWHDLEKIGIKTINDATSLKQSHSTGNIVLSGLRGTGKTIIGQKIAKLLGYGFIDTDQMIENDSGMKIASIVKKHGWDHFRRLEANTARQLSGRQRTVISTGGGMLTNPRNAASLKKNSSIILLRCDSAIAAKRISGDLNRPSLTHLKNGILELEELWRQRQDSYLQAADFIIDTSAQSDNINNDVIRKASEIIKLINA